MKRGLLLPALLAVALGVGCCFALAAPGLFHVFGLVSAPREPVSVEFAPGCIHIPAGDQGFARLARITVRAESSGVSAAKLRVELSNARGLSKHFDYLIILLQSLEKVIHEEQGVKTEPHDSESDGTYDLLESTLEQASIDVHSVRRVDAQILCYKSGQLVAESDVYLFSVDWSSFSTVNPAQVTFGYNSSKQGVGIKEIRIANTPTSYETITQYFPDDLRYAIVNVDGDGNVVGDDGDVIYDKIVLKLTLYDASGVEVGVAEYIFNVVQLPESEIFESGGLKVIKALELTIRAEGCKPAQPVVKLTLRHPVAPLAVSFHKSSTALFVVKAFYESKEKMLYQSIPIELKATVVSVT